MTALAFEMKCLNDVVFLLLQCLHVFLQLLNIFLGKFCKNWKFLIFKNEFK